MTTLDVETTSHPSAARDRAVGGVQLSARLMSSVRAVALLAAAAVVANRIATILLFNGWPGFDFPPLRNAAENLLAGRSVYAAHAFVYPPVAAVLLTPLALGSALTAFKAWTILGVLAVAAAGVLVGRQAAHGRVLVTAAAIGVLVAGAPAEAGFVLGQLSVLLAPLAIVVVAAFHRERWLLGCAVLTASLLIKPLLVPLLLVPLIWRRNELWTALVPAGLVLAVSMLAVPGGTDVAHFVGYIASGTSLHGVNAFNNLSWSGVVELHRWPHLLSPLGSTALVIVVAAITWRHRVPHDPVFRIQVALLAFATTLVAGGISEVHFLVVLLALIAYRLVTAPGRSTALYVPVVGALFVGPWRLGLDSHAEFNTWYFACELLAVSACLLDVATSARTEDEEVTR